MNKYPRTFKILTSKVSGLSLLELSMTIAISGIMLISVAALVSAAVKTMNYIYLTNQKQDNSRIVLNILTNDLYFNKGNFQITKESSFTKLSFDLIATEAESIEQVNYICDHINNKLFRDLNDLNSKLLLNNISHCEFVISDLNNTSPNMQVIIRLIPINEDLPVDIYEVINVPKGT